MRFRLGSNGRTNPGARRLRWPGGPARSRGWAAAAGAAVVIAATLAGVVVAGIFPGPGAAASSRPAAAPSGRGRAAAQAKPARGGRPAAPARAGRPVSAPASPPAAPAPPARTVARPWALRTSCRSVAHIGDSTSVDLTAAGGNIPDPAQQLPARYAHVGVRHLLLDASGGRSIVEALPGQVNGYDVAENWWNQGYRGCWVFALGTNDTANVSVGSSVGIMGRIREMMSVAHGEPVMWVNTVTQLGSGPWSEANEQAWDNALVSALPMYPNMRIFDWAAMAQPGWFLPDGIHYNTVGCVERARAIAGALARAFPRHGQSRGQIVR